MDTLDIEIEGITQMIWETLFELPIRRDDASALGVEPTVTGIVHIDGAWHGAVMLRCPVPLAVALAAAMFQGDTEPSFDDVRDALGELTNMIAGNLKSLLPQPCVISLPAVARGTDYDIGVLGTAVVATVPFVCDGRPLIVTLVKRTGDGVVGA